jgi:acyl-coenzyme A thioesterase PaaI-like protein
MVDHQNDGVAPGLTPLPPRPENRCFGCGGANERGMQLTFARDDARRRIVGRFTLGAEYQGGPGFLHGGIIATVLDEAMGKVNRFHDLRAVTAELRVEYLRPVPVGEEFVVEAFGVQRSGRNLIHAAELRSRTGQLLVRGRARFVAVDEARDRQKPRESNPPEEQTGRQT